MEVILASRSPRRRELLKDLFEDFEVIPCDVEEKTSLKRGHAICQYLAKIKLGDLPTRRPDALIISADTVVYMDGRVYGKPQDEAGKEVFGRTQRQEAQRIYGRCDILAGRYQRVL